MQFLVSAGEASGDLYASEAVRNLRTLLPNAEFFGCAGPRLQGAGVEPVVDASSLAVVGLAEVVSHLPRIYGEYRKLLATAKTRRPVAALLTDSPDFHLRVARHLKAQGVPVFYLVAPQVWAWRQSRVRQIREVVDHLFCLFPFEERWFRERGVNATYIGHPLVNIVKPARSRAEFFAANDIDPTKQTVVLLPGSRVGEIARHLPDLIETVSILRVQHRARNVVLATAKGAAQRELLRTFQERMQAAHIKVLEDQTWDAIAHADVALAASGTVTVEAAVLGTPMVTFYKVMPLSWALGRRLVKAPFLTMVNLIANRQIVPELMQHDMTPQRLATEVSLLLDNPQRAAEMRAELAALRRSLSPSGDPFQLVAETIATVVGHPLTASA